MLSSRSRIPHEPAEVARCLATIVLRVIAEGSRTVPLLIAQMLSGLVEVR